ncbi:unnamed protein product [Paramecium sonneborni]|uniref:DUF4485 domain-containing protein n=1 Tax=Paramecium sonneborni TaxID=65129 RepID=A0A8S1QLA2_9CILI|nr:unnamed protein product [Paramecium sonneborni]
MDEEFIKVMLSIEEAYQNLNKHQKIRVEAWTKKLCQVTTNEVWKKNRNLYARILLNQVSKGILSEPFDKRPPEGPLPKLNRYLVLNDQKENSRPQVFKKDSLCFEQQQQQQQFAECPNLQEKMLKLLIDCRQYLEKRTDQEAILLKEQQDQFFVYLQELNQPYILEQIDEKTEENEDQQKDTMQFLQYLDNFEKKTEKLRVETEKLLRGNNIQYNV